MPDKIIYNNEPSPPVGATAGYGHPLHQAVRLQRMPHRQLQLRIAQLHLRRAGMSQHLRRNAHLVLHPLSSLAGCTGNAQYYNPCWVTCKNSTARSNSNWLSLSLCYENVCYLGASWLSLALATLIVLYLL